MSPTGACIRGGEMQLYCLRAAVINYFLPDKIFSIYSRYFYEITELYLGCSLYWQIAKFS